MEKLPGHIEFEIKDEGGGIKKDVRSRINSGSGSGVRFRGMQERVKQMGGTLDVQSSEKGTSVRVLLPISA
jgi:two-component system NarL family sensor kinase